jgi:uncharacterized membrane protein YbjE (DUF340 family)
LRVPFSVYTLGFLSAGFLFGYYGFIVPEDSMDYALDVLIIVAGFLIGVELSTLKRNARIDVFAGGALSLSTIASSMVAGLLASYILGADLRIGATIGGASGWYSLAGPLISSVDPYWGLIGFLSNLTREIIHIILYPLLARCCWFPAISIGGATTMDTGLPVITLYGGRRAGLIAMIHGGLITLFAPILLQFVLF